MEGSHWHCRRAPWALEQHLVVAWGSRPLGLNRLPLAGVVAWVRVGGRFTPVGNMPVRHTPGALEGSRAAELGMDLWTPGKVGTGKDRMKGRVCA